MKDNITELYARAGIEADTSENAYLTGNYNKLPEFNAEKQINLIKAIATKSNLKLIFGEKEVCNGFFASITIERLKEDRDFAQALAGVVLQLWDNLPAEWIKDIKRALK